MIRKHKRSFSKSKLYLETEKEAWEKCHNLDCDPVIAEYQLKQLNEFSSKLCLCFEEKCVNELKYQHWFITDLVRYIEFGDGNTLHPFKLDIHSRKKALKYCVFKTFDLTEDVRERIHNVLGATNYSIMLRNSEHLARYIHCGRWISPQTTTKTNLKKKFLTHMPENRIKLLNTLPSELITNTISERTEIYNNDTQNRLTFEKKQQCLTDDDNLFYNIVFIGPTGCGKSSLINLLFNETVTISEGGATSVTRGVSFLQGSGELKETFDGISMEIIQPKLNVIDTIGLCDSEMDEDEVFSYIKDKLQTNLLHIDRVVMVCSGRVQGCHQDAMKNFMKWLKYKEFKTNFAFIYNKSDLVSEENKLDNLNDTCGMLGIDATSKICNGNVRPTELVFTLGVPPNSEFEAIKDDLMRLQEGVLVPTCEENIGFNHPEEDTHQRIPINRDQCTIL